MIKKSFFSVLILFASIALQAQEASGSFGSTYVPGNGFISIFGDHTFDFADCGLFPGLILTERDNGIGYVNFTSSATWTGANNESHVDGYVRTFATTPFVFPVGDDGRVRFIGIDGSENTGAAYFAADPAEVTGQLTVENADLDGVSTREYWMIGGGDDDTRLTLSWDQLSGVEDLVDGDINKLTIIGWVNDDWEIIPSVINEFALASSSANIFDEDITTSFTIGSLSSADPIDLDRYQVLSIGSLAAPRTSVVEKGDLKVFPNPAPLGTPTFVSYNLKGQKGKMEVYDGYNRLVFNQTLMNNQGTILLPELNGEEDRYVVTIIEEDGTKTSKILLLLR